MSNDQAISELQQEVPVLKNRIEHIENAQEKQEALLNKIVENCTLLSQRVVAAETKAEGSDYLLKWLLGGLAGTFAGIVALLFQAYIK
jgi:uncharacterized protein involved in exopolysaccharide biosynthesis